MPHASLQAIRNTRPQTLEHLHDWVKQFTGIHIARESVCEGHTSPFDCFVSWYRLDSSVALVQGPRGGGKSFLSALDSHIKSRFNPRYGTRVLGGSRAQSEQVYRALKDIVADGRGPLGSERDTVRRLLKTETNYRNGSEVSILAASPTAVRGPHVPSLKLDEVDEIDPDIRESAMGMCMSRHGHKASVLMTSTWHRVAGPMAGLVEQAKSGAFPIHTFCLFEVLERCPDSRSGPNLEYCPSCPLMKWCHDGPVPKAKRSDGHYSIDSAIQKVIATSRRVFEADYLCLGPRADGVWFPGFSAGTHVSTRAEFDPALPVYLAIDSGVFTGAVWFQVARWRVTTGNVEEIRVFADYLSENIPAEQNAKAILAIAGTRCNGRRDVVATDPAGGARNPVGPNVIGEYERAGLRPIRRWPIGPVSDGLSLVDSFVQPADGIPRLIVHPRCVPTIAALANYRRAKRAGQWQDYPEDPQHPHEDLVDALRGGIRTAFPDGRRPAPHLTTQPMTRVFY
jgi:hypothetical protein